MNDDYIYLVMLVFSIAFGGVTRSIGNATLRKWTSSLVGLAIVVVVSGAHAVHPVLSFLIHTTLIFLSPKAAVHWINFFVGFAYLVWQTQK